MVDKSTPRGNPTKARKLEEEQALKNLCLQIGFSPDEYAFFKDNKHFLYRAMFVKVKNFMDSINVRLQRIEMLTSGAPTGLQAMQFIEQNFQKLYEQRQKQLKSMQGKSEGGIIVNPNLAR